MGRRRRLAVPVAIALTVAACGPEYVETGDMLQPGHEVRYRFRAHCGARILGSFNGRWWRATEALKLRGSAAVSWYPPEWRPTYDENFSDVLPVVLRYDGDRQRIVARWRDRAVTYEPGPELAPWETCA
jgi:hypothetical protein